MNRFRTELLLAISCSLLAAFAVSPASGALIPGGGNGRTDCYAEFDVQGAAATSTRSAQCMDGDPACDFDGVCGNNSCRFNVAACLNQTDAAFTTCIPPGPELPLKKAIERGRRRKRIGLAFPGALDSSACGSFVGTDVPIKRNTRKPGRVVHMRAVSPRRPHKDNDALRLFCVANPDCTAPPGGTCPANTAGGPNRLVQTVLGTGTDLDNGFSGDSHNFPVIEGSRLEYCLSNCNDSNDPVCDATGATGAGTPNGITFGPPLPLVAGGVPVCVVNTYRNATITGTANVQTGELTGQIDLNSTVITTPPSRVCPQCRGGGGGIGSQGSCEGGPNNGRACTVEGLVRVNSDNPPINNALYTLSSQCPPGGLGTENAGTLQISLPLTTGTSTKQGPRPCPGQTQDDACGTSATCVPSCPGTPPLKGGLYQTCCSNEPSRPCFPTRGGGTIERTGTAVAPQPSWDTDKVTYPKTGSGTTAVAVFCIPATTSSTVNQVSGLPGPGAIILPVTQNWLRE
jgi:hypothetical protein